MHQHVLVDEFQDLSRVQEGRRILSFRIDWAATETEWIEAMDTPDAPEAPEEIDDELCETAFLRGYRLLREVVDKKAGPNGCSHE